MLSINKNKILLEQKELNHSVIPFYVNCMTCRLKDKDECVDDTIKIKRKFNTTVIQSNICTNWVLNSSILKLITVKSGKNDNSYNNKKRKN